MRRAAAIDELEERVNVHAAIVRQPGCKLSRETQALKPSHPPLHPARLAGHIRWLSPLRPHPPL
jgi:hypothetical protein